MLAAVFRFQYSETYETYQSEEKKTTAEYYTMHPEGCVVHRTYQHGAFTQVLHYALTYRRRCSHATQSRSELSLFWFIRSTHAALRHLLRYLTLRYTI